MDLTLSRRGDYVTRAAMSLARAFDNGEYRKIRELVVDTQIPASFAPQVLSDLVRVGLVNSKAGKHGGYRLARRPDTVSLLDVIEAAEGPLRPGHCALGAGPCRWEQVCPLHETWSAAATGLRTVLADTSLAELAARDLAIAQGTYEIPDDAHRGHPVVIDVTDQAQVEFGVAETHAALARLPTELGYLIDSPDAEASLAPDPPRRRHAPSHRYLVTWRLTEGNQSKSSRFDGELTVSHIDDQRCEIELAGSCSYLPPDVGDTPAESQQRARLAVRGFLRNLTRALETPP